MKKLILIIALLLFSSTAQAVTISYEFLAHHAYLEASIEDVANGTYVYQDNQNIPNSSVSLEYGEIAVDATYIVDMNLENRSFHLNYDFSIYNEMPEDLFQVGLDTVLDTAIEFTIDPFGEYSVGTPVKIDVAYTYFSVFDPIERFNEPSFHLAFFDYWLDITTPGFDIYKEFIPDGVTYSGSVSTTAITGGTYDLDILLTPDAFNSNAEGRYGTRNETLDIYVQLTITPIPEPTTIALLGIGLAGLAGVALRRGLKREEN